MHGYPVGQMGQNRSRNGCPSTACRAAVAASSARPNSSKVSMRCSIASSRARSSRAHSATTAGHRDHIGQRRPPPQVKRLGPMRQRLLRPALTHGLAGQAHAVPELIHIAVAGRRQFVTANSRHQYGARVRKQATQPKDITVNRLHRSRRRMIPPNLEYQPVKAHHGSAGGQHHREHRPLLTCIDRHPFAPREHPQRAQHPKPHRLITPEVCSTQAFVIRTETDCRIQRSSTCSAPIIHRSICLFEHHVPPQPTVAHAVLAHGIEGRTLAARAPTSIHIG